MNSLTSSLPADEPLQDVIMLGGFPIVRTDSARLIEHLAQRLDRNEQQILCFANTNLIVQCQSMAEQMSKPPVLIVNDGVGIDIATWLIQKQTFIENLNGTDFTPAFLQAVKNRANVFLFGAKPGIAERAAKVLEESGVNIVGLNHGYVKAPEMPGLIERINASEANVVLVAIGNPAQERWLLEHHRQLRASILVGVGALLDFLAGDKPRAPALVQKLRLEWFYRLCLEPTRLLRRYTLDIGKFLALCFAKEKARKQSSRYNEPNPR
jgi:beta-1,4-glucosyltransferase